MKINPFINVPILKDWKLDNTHVAYAFVTYEPSDDTREFDIKDDILKFDKSVDKLLNLLYTTIDALQNILNESTKTLINEVIISLNQLKNLLQNFFGIIISDNSIEANQMLESVWTGFVGMESKIKLLFIETEFILENFFITLKSQLNSEVNALKTRITKTANNITNKLIKSTSSFTGFGFKYTVSLKILELYIGDFDMELVYSDGGLLKCSRFAYIKDLLKEKSALRLIGRKTRFTPLNFFLQSRIGTGIGMAFSLTSPKFIAQLEVYINVLGIKITGDLFFTIDGLYLYIEGNIWNIFLAHVDFSAEVGKNWDTLTFRVKGMFVSKGRKRRQIQTKHSSFNDSYADGLKKAINFVANSTTKRLSQVQVALTTAQKGISTAQSWLDSKQRKVKDANVAFDNAVALLKNANDQLEALKKPYEEALKSLEKAQRNVDNLCKIRSCKIWCIPFLRCKWCSKRGPWGSRIRYPCCSNIKCYFKIPDKFCVIANLACRVIRAAAYDALEIAQTFVRTPMLAFDAAKSLVSKAQVVFDKSRVILDVAESLLNMAKNGLEFAKDVLEAAKLTFDAVKVALGVAVRVLEYVIDIGMKRIVDVKNCGFDVQISTTDIHVFQVSCDVNAFQLGGTTIKIKVNFKNILQSIWNAARATVDALMKSLKNTSIIGRKRREVLFKSNAKMHATLLRKIRDTDTYNESGSFINEGIDVSENISGHSEGIYDDYTSRVLLFKEKCTKITNVMDFMQESFDALHGIINDSMQVIYEMESIKVELHSYTNASLLDNMTLEDVGISKESAENDFNMTNKDLERVVEDTKASVLDDPLLTEINSATDLSLETLDDEMESIEAIQYLDIWLLAINNVTEDYFDETVCKGFMDCVLYSISVLYDLYEDEDVPDIDKIRNIIIDLERILIEMFQNETQHITDMTITMNSVLASILYLNTTNPFCSVAPTIHSNLNNQTIPLSLEAVFICNATGNPSPKFWWLKNEQVLPNENRSRLIISNVTAEHSAVYTCIAGNVVANITSNEAYLYIIDHGNYGSYVIYILRHL